MRSIVMTLTIVMLIVSGCNITSQRRIERGLNLYPDQHINIEEIPASLFNEMANESQESKLNPLEFNGGYLDFNGRKYLMTSLEGPYYPIFDYGIISQIGSLGPGLEGIYFYDIKANKISQLSDCWYGKINFFSFKNYIILQYPDKDSSSGDAGYNRDLKMVLFTRDSKSRLLVKYIKLGQGDETFFDKAFWMSNTFYFSINYDSIKGRAWKRADRLKFYSLNISNDDVDSENIFHKREIPLLRDRDVTDLAALQVVHFCKGNKLKQSDALVDMGSWNGKDYESKNFFAECVIQTAVENNDSTICEEFSPDDEKRNESWYTRFKEDCYFEVASKTGNIELCNNVPDMEHKNWMRNKDKCIMNVAIAKNDSSMCSLISINAWYKEDCYDKLARASS